MTLLLIAAVYWVAFPLFLIVLLVLWDALRLFHRAGKARIRKAEQAYAAAMDRHPSGRAL